MEDDNTATDIHRFSDFADHGEKKPIKEIVGRDLIIQAFCVRPSRYDNDYLTIQFRFEPDGENYVVFTGSTVLSEQLREHAEKLPFVAAIQKIGKYYSFV